ncbi:hypothetical protein IPJ72_00510 [Candidatus Peregrinibacteria bacterium]|nr:MAG: hypothetical protein IPJ72_00510 [Candidatus Peregrinibacteria bacterium]
MLTSICATATCQKPFKVIDQEEQFLTQRHLPMPIHCPRCRHQQRMALRSERALYPRVCSRCEKKVLSTLPESSPYSIVCQDCFWKGIA